MAQTLQDKNAVSGGEAAEPGQVNADVGFENLDIADEEDEALPYPLGAFHCPLLDYWEGKKNKQLQKVHLYLCIHIHMYIHAHAYTCASILCNGHYFT
jgi:hypothetical protein